MSTTQVLKNYVGFSRDHSGSMYSIAQFAARDYNTNILAIQQESLAQNQDTIVSVMQCGIGRPAVNKFEIVNSNVARLQPISENSYAATGSSTPLFDSVGDIIDQFKQVPDYNDDMVSFLVMVITDGGDNASRKWSGPSLGAEIRRLQATDRWTFVFRVPRGDKAALVRLGIPEGNILEWDQTQRGVEAATQATTQALKGFYADRAAGKKSTQTFYADLSKVDAATIKTALSDISQEVSLWPVLPQEHGAQIRDFVEKRLGSGMLKGAAFYELTKLEREVQDYKKIVIRDKTTQLMYGGDAARQLLGLPAAGTVKLAPGAHGNYDVFIQSTSVNRKVQAGSHVLYWPKIGSAYTEGPSAPIKR